MAPDVILANSTPVTAVLRQQGQIVPIVFTKVTDPVADGLVRTWRIRAAMPPGFLGSSWRSARSGWSC